VIAAAASAPQTVHNLLIVHCPSVALTLALRSLTTMRCFEDGGVSVCGSDGRTYRGACELRREACRQGVELTVVDDDECDDDVGSGSGGKYLPLPPPPSPTPQPQFSSVACILSTL